MRISFALAQMMRQMLGRQPLQVQRDPDPVGRAAAEVAMQLHRNLPRGFFLQLACLPVRSDSGDHASHIVSMLSIKST